MITGAASGIGAASARLFAAEGCKVVLADIQDGRGAALADALGACYRHADVCSERAMRALPVAVPPEGAR